VSIQLNLAHVGRN